MSGINWNMTNLQTNGFIGAPKYVLSPTKVGIEFEDSLNCGGVNGSAQYFGISGSVSARTIDIFYSGRVERQNAGFERISFTLRCPNQPEFQADTLIFFTGSYNDGAGCAMSDVPRLDYIYYNTDFVTINGQNITINNLLGTSYLDIAMYTGDGLYHTDAYLNLDFSFTALYGGWMIGKIGSNSVQSFVGSTPVAIFTYSPSQPIIPDSKNVTFNASGSYVTGGSISSYYWDFGNGTTASGVNPSTTYESPGSYTVTLNVFSNSGVMATTSQQIVVEKEDIEIEYLGSTFPVIAAAGATSITLPSFPSGHSAGNLMILHIRGKHSGLIAPTYTVTEGFTQVARVTDSSTSPSQTIVNEVWFKVAEGTAATEPKPVITSSSNPQGDVFGPVLYEFANTIDTYLAGPTTLVSPKGPGTGNFTPAGHSASSDGIAFVAFVSRTSIGTPGTTSIINSQGFTTALEYSATIPGVVAFKKVTLGAVNYPTYARGTTNNPTTAITAVFAEES